jgi:hypothetical protein
MAVVLVEGDDKLPGLVGNASTVSSAGRTRRTGYWTVPMAITAVFALS